MRSSLLILSVTLILGCGLDSPDAGPGSTPVENSETPPRESDVKGLWVGLQEEGTWAILPGSDITWASWSDLGKVLLWSGPSRQLFVLDADLNLEHEAFVGTDQGFLALGQADDETLTGVTGEPHSIVELAFSGEIIRRDKLDPDVHCSAAIYVEGAWLVLAGTASGDGEEHRLLRISPQGEVEREIAGSLPRGFLSSVGGKPYLTEPDFPHRIYTFDNDGAEEPVSTRPTMVDSLTVATKGRSRDDWKSYGVVPFGDGFLQQLYDRNTDWFILLLWDATKTLYKWPVYPKWSAMFFAGGGEQQTLYAIAKDPDPRVVKYSWEWERR